MGYFWGRGRVQKLFWGLLIWTNDFCFLRFALFLLYHVVLSLWWVVFSEYFSIYAISCTFEFVWWWWVGGGYQQLLSLNPTTVFVVLLLGLWLLLGCDNIEVCKQTIKNCEVLLCELECALHM